MSERAIIGKIPGYNANIDKGGRFEKELKKGLTYVDLYPTAYTDARKLINKAKDVVSGTEARTSEESFFGENLDELFTSPGLVASVPSTGASNGDPSYDLFKGVLQRMQNSFGMHKSFASAKSIRIVAANDSTFTETFTNSFDNNNVVVSAFDKAKRGVESIPLIPSITKGLKSFDSSAMQSLVGGIYKAAEDASGKGGLSELLTGAALGMNIAAPQMWSASQYNSTLTLFIKLISPTGQPECIRKNILEPLLYLIAASSPITAYGMVYGYPLLWQVHAHGITNFRIGSIAALSIIRGSFETTFTTSLQPTVIDVRLTIIPLLTDFAVQTDTSEKSIYTGEQVDYLGVQNPGDIHRGTMNTGPVGGAAGSPTTRSQTMPNIISVQI